jgi:hypothetical protein
MALAAFDFLAGAPGWAVPAINAISDPPYSMDFATLPVYAPAGQCKSIS